MGKTIICSSFIRQLLRTSWVSGDGEQSWIRLSSCLQPTHKPAGKLIINCQSHKCGNTDKCCSLVPESQSSVLIVGHSAAICAIVILKFRCLCQSREALSPDLPLKVKGAKLAAHREYNCPLPASSFLPIHAKPCLPATTTPAP